MADYQSKNFNLRDQSIAGRRTWLYEDTGPVTDVAGAGFVTDGAAKGAKVDDIVEYVDTSRHLAYHLRVSNVTDTGGTQLTLDGQVLVTDTS
jgi:hypothetical protein